MTQLHMIDNFSADKYEIVKEMFLHTADENYIIARWAFDQNIQTIYLWNAAQAIEKYVKAALLLNGRALRKQEKNKDGHNIEKLFNELKSVAGDLLLESSSIANESRMRMESHPISRDFLMRLNRDGAPDVRYLMDGSLHLKSDIDALDSAVFAIRRLTWPLDVPYDVKIEGEEAAPTYREYLKSNVRFFHPHRETLERLIQSKECPELSRAALNLNLQFAPSGYRHQPKPGFTSVRNPVVMRCIFEPLADDDFESVQNGLKIANWTMDNIFLSKKLRGDIKKARDDAIHKWNLNQME
jgi:HEPN domain-containing protein